jgi:polar amino acid transport system permease protein
VDHLRLHGGLDRDRHRGGDGRLLRTAVTLGGAADRRQDLQEIFRCTPLLVQILWAFYALPMLTGNSISNMAAGLLTLSLYVGSFYAEIFRGGINAVDKGQSEAAAAVGMSGLQIMRHVMLPQAIKKMLPAFINQSVIQVKNTSLLYAISVAELTYMTSVVNSDTYRPMEAYTLAAVMYFAMFFPLTQ